MPILEDDRGNTALDVAFEKQDVNLANTLLVGLENYPFLSHGFVIVSGILKAFHTKCPHVGEFLDSRLVKTDHLE